MNDLSANNFRLLLAGMLLWFDAPDDPLPSQVCAPRAACKPDRRHQAQPAWPFTAVFRWPMEAERERVEAEHDLRIGSNVNPVVDAPLAHVLIRGAVTTIPTLH